MSAFGNSLGSILVQQRLALARLRTMFYSQEVADRRRLDDFETRYRES